MKLPEEASSSSPSTRSADQVVADSELVATSTQARKKSKSRDMLDALSEIETTLDTSPEPSAQPPHQHSSTTIIPSTKDYPKAKWEIQQEKWDAMEEDEFEDGDLIVQDGKYFAYKREDEKASLPPRYIPLSDAYTSLKEATQIATFLSGVLKTPPISEPKPDPKAVQTTTFFMHGIDSNLGANLDDDDTKDSYQWSLPGSGYKTKIDLPRLGNIDDVATWQVKLMESTDAIIVLLRTLPPENHPFRGLSEAEMRTALVQVFDPRMLLKRNAQKQLSTLCFDGRALRSLSNSEIYKALMDYAADLNKTSTKDGILKKLQALQMTAPTFELARAGRSASRLFEALYLDFTGVLEECKYTGFDGTNTLSHTLVTLIEPLKLRQYAINHIHECIVNRRSVPQYSGPPMLISLTNVWSVFNALRKQFKEHIDVQMLHSVSFLDTLYVENFCYPTIPRDFLAMAISPHRGRNKRDSSESSTKETPSPPKRPRHHRHPKTHGGRPPRGAGSAPPNSTKPTKAPTSGGATSDGKPSGVDSTSVNRTSTTVATCCLCASAAHKARKCDTFETCTCGAPMGPKAKKHDPFRCAKGPLTEEGKAKLSSLQRRK